MHEEHSNNHPARGSSLPRMRPSQSSRYSDSNAVTQPVPQKMPPRGGSLDRRRLPPKAGIVDVDIANRTPVLANKYVIERNMDNRTDQVGKISSMLNPKNLKGLLHYAIYFDPRRVALFSFIKFLLHTFQCMYSSAFLCCWDLPHFFRDNFKK